MPKLGWLSVASVFAFIGCSAPSGQAVGGGDDSVTEVPESSVKDQSTDNCWVYSTTGWVESLHLRATGKELNLSESYLTYWSWYEQIVGGQISGGAVEEGGSWGEAGDLIRKYGMMNEADFIPPEADAILSKRQEVALKAINDALKKGSLRTGAARRNRTLVRDVLDSAWHLRTQAIAYLDHTFGHDVSKTLEKDYATGDLPAGVPIYRASELKADLTNPATGRLEHRTVFDAIGTHKSSSNTEHRNGDFAWQEVTYPRSQHDRRDFWKRVQRALNDKQPVLINWTIDFNALTDDGRFPDVPAKPGSQGGHMVLGYDYAVDDVPGFGSLEAGVLVTNQAALEAALDDAAQVRFIRVKNSWSPTYHPLPPPAPGGYHDLYLKYLNGPMKMCSMDKDDNAVMSTCKPGIPLESMVLPAGY